MKKNVVAILKEDGIAYLMLLPKLLLFAVFTVYPIFWALRFAFYDYNGVSQAVFTGFDNLIRAFTRDPIWWQSVANTFVYAFFKLIIEVPLALVLAVVLNQSLKGRGLFRGIFFLPTVVSAAVISLVFSFIYSPYNGILNTVLMNLGLINQNILWLDTPRLAMVSIVIVGIWQAFGQTMVLILAGLQNISNDVYEAAEIDGSGTINTFFKITLPMLAPMLQLILMLAMIGSLSAFDSIYVLTGGGPDNATQVMGISIYQQFFAPDKQPMYGYGAMLAVLSSLIIGSLTAVYMGISRKMKDMV